MKFIRLTLSVFLINICTMLCLIAQDYSPIATFNQNNQNSANMTNIQNIEHNEQNEHNQKSQYKEQLFSAALYGSSDSIKTSINLDFSYPIYRFTKSEIRGYTSIVGYKLFDSDNPNLYMLGFGQRFSFGKLRKNIGQVEITRYGFAFFSIGFMSFDADKNPKFLFTTPLFYEVGGGAGFNIFATHYMSVVLEVGGGINKTIGGDDYFATIKRGAFGKISVGSRYYF